MAVREVPANQRHRLGEAFALALVDRNCGANQAQIEAARAKAHRAPRLLLAIARLMPCVPYTPLLERMVSMGAAIQNLLLGAHAIGLGAGLTNGPAMTSPRMRDLLHLAVGEEAVCRVNLGHATLVKSQTRLRPAPSRCSACSEPPEGKWWQPLARKPPRADAADRHRPARSGRTRPSAPRADGAHGCGHSEHAAGAHAMGFAAGLTSGQAISSPRLGALCQLDSGEAAVCCINIGTGTRRKERERLRPPPRQLFSVLSSSSPPSGV